MDVACDYVSMSMAQFDYSDRNEWSPNWLPKSRSTDGPQFRLTHYRRFRKLNNQQPISCPATATLTPVRRVGSRTMEEAVKEYQLEWFDPDGETSIRWTAAGRFWLHIQFIPPSWAEDDSSGPNQLGSWDDFDKRLEQAIGVPVVWEDREWFRIDRPRKDTVSAIQSFLLSLRPKLDTSSG